MGVVNVFQIFCGATVCDEGSSQGLCQRVVYPAWPACKKPAKVSSESPKSAAEHPGLQTIGGKRMGFWGRHWYTCLYCVWITPPRFCIKCSVFWFFILFVNVSLQAVRQEHIRGLIKANSVAKTELKLLHAEVRISTFIINSILWWKKPCLVRKCMKTFWTSTLLSCFSYRNLSRPHSCHSLEMSSVLPTIWGTRFQRRSKDLEWFHFLLWTAGL